MAKTYPLQIEEMCDPDNGDVFGYFSKGHWSDEEFDAALLAFLDGNLDRRMKPCRDWWRSALYGKERVYDIGKPGERGCFPVTVVDTW